jgi:glucuronoarabinoxylan endo-1,4-beta-xylanase
MSFRFIKKIFVFTLLLIYLIISSCSKKSESITEPSEFVDPADTIPKSAVIYLNKTQQVIRGFGGVNMAGWNDVGDLTPEQVAKAFGNDSGQIGMTILRIRVPYDSSKFYLEVPVAKLAVSYGAIVIASPWSPPPSLKSNNNIIGGTLKDDSYADYAAHLNAFSEYMKKNSAPLYAISIQNEPDANVNYESCNWNASQLLKFIREYDSSIGTRIIVPESMNFNRSLSDPILSDPVAAANISIIGGHIYGGGIASYPLATDKGKEVWMTEHLTTNTSWSADLSIASEIDNCLYYEMSAYIWWYIRRYYGPINEDGDVTKRGYVISQFAKFIRPGFTKVYVNAKGNPQEKIYFSAYKKDSKVVIVVINRNSNPVDQLFIIREDSATKFTPFVTSGAKNCFKENEINVTNNRFTYTLEEESVTSFVSD